MGGVEKELSKLRSFNENFKHNFQNYADLLKLTILNADNLRKMITFA